MAKARAEEIHKLRESKGWSQEMLAKKAGIDPKTMSKLLNGAECRLSTISLIAQALGVEPGSLIVGNDPNPPLEAIPWASGEKPVKVKIEFELEFDSFDDLKFVESMLPKMRKSVGMDHEINVTAVARGSVLVTVSMSPGDADSLILAYLDGTLDKFSVKSLTILSEDYECPWGLPSVIDPGVRARVSEQAKEDRRRHPPSALPPETPREPDRSPRRPDELGD